MKLYELADAVELESTNKVIVRYYDYDNMSNVDVAVQKYDLKVGEVDEKYRRSEVKYVYAELDNITEKANLVIEVDFDPRFEDEENFDQD